MSKEELLKVLGPGNLPAWIGSPDCVRVSWVNDLLGKSSLCGTGSPCWHGLCDACEAQQVSSALRIRPCHPRVWCRASALSAGRHRLQRCRDTSWSVLDGDAVRQLLCRQNLSAARREPALNGLRTQVLSPAEQLWPRLQDVFNLRYKEVAEPLIQQSKPRWVFETRILSFEIGDVPPTITGVKAFKESSSPNHVSALLR